MIEALIAGESDPERLAQLAHRRIKAPPEALCEALRGRVTLHHRFLLRLHLKQIDAVNVAIDDIDQEVDAQIEPFRTAIQLLITIPGVSELSACVILAEIGHDRPRHMTGCTPVHGNIQNAAAKTRRASSELAYRQTITKSGVLGCQPDKHGRAQHINRDRALEAGFHP
jgi:hypothetical protein